MGCTTQSMARYFNLFTVLVSVIEPAAAIEEHSGFRCHFTISGNIIVAWDAVKGTSSYEVQVATSQTATPFLAVHNHAPFADVAGLHSKQTYYFRMRYHKGYDRDEGWSELGEALSSKDCTASVSDVGAGQLSQRSSEEASTDVDTFHIIVVRESRSDQPDYLSEHNAANYEGESSFLSGHAHSFSLIQQFCVEMMKPPHGIANASTTGGHASYANYASCQKSGDKPYRCAKINDPDCNWLHLTHQECSNARTKESVDYSSQFVGLGVYNSSDGERRLYSFPRDAECKGEQRMGSTKRNGVRCTWRSRGDFRLTTGKKGMTAAALKKAFNSAPIAHFSCGNAPTPGRRSAMIV